MVLKKISSVALSAVMATTLMVPFTAFADQQPSVEYTGGNGDPITHLYLIADDTNLANNYTESWNKEHAKVEVPVAIHYVAQANGTIVGPNDEAAQIRNFAGFPVNVSNILTTAGTNVTLVSTPEAADQADEIYLTMTPNSGTAISLADFTSSATESSSGADDGTGKRPDAGAEWNIAAAVSGVGTENAVASILNLNSLSGKIGGFNQLNPAAEQEIGQINWQIKPGTYAISVPTVPASLATASLTQLTAVSSALRAGTVQPSEVSSLVGQTVTVTLKDNSTATARLVDATAARGLVFQFDFTSPITTAAMNSSYTNAGGWTGSAMRTSLNSGDIFHSKLQGMTIAGETVDPVATTLNSLDYNGGTPQVITTTGDKFWLASVAEVYGPSAWTTLNWGYTGTEDGTQFAYYATLQPDPTNDQTNPLASASLWWLRSAHPETDLGFMRVDGGGTLTVNGAGSSDGVVPCFCL